MMEYWNVELIFEDQEFIFLYDVTHYSTIPIFHYDFTPDSELSLLQPHD